MIPPKSVNDANIDVCPLLLQVYVTVMDSNDNAPIFSQPAYEVTVSEDIPPDAEVIQVAAVDRDRRHQLSYSLQSSIDPGSMRFFRIHPTLGTIYTLQSLDHEACALHILTVSVSVWLASVALRGSIMVNLPSRLALTGCR